MRLRISLEDQSYDVDVEILPELPEIDSYIEVPLTVLRLPPPIDIRPEDKVCRSPIAGVVMSVAVCVGQEVQQDDPVLVIEAMKMQTAIGAPIGGTVETVHVVPGEIVRSGQPLCTLV
jgi:biotin carboxyl carrier protein